MASRLVVRGSRPPSVRLPLGHPTGWQVHRTYCVPNVVTNHLTRGELCRHCYVGWSSWACWDVRLCWSRIAPRQIRRKPAIRQINRRALERVRHSLGQAGPRLLIAWARVQLVARVDRRPTPRGPAALTEDPAQVVLAPMEVGRPEAGRPAGAERALERTAAAARAVLAPMVARAPVDRAARVERVAPAPARTIGPVKPAAPPIPLAGRRVA